MTQSKKKIPTAELPEVERWEDVPEFADEKEEAEFWSSHGLGEGLLSEELTDDDLGLPEPRSKPKPVAVRLDAETTQRLKTLATKKNKGYQTLLKEFVMERLYEEEKREGLFTP